MIQFDLLGQVTLRNSAGDSVDRLLRQPKRIALLAFLASPSPGTWHRRDIVLAMFWPELDTAHARTSLRNAVYVLRQALGDAVIANRGDDELSVNPDELNTDLTTLRAALGAGDHATALLLYRGDLLPGLYPADSEGFERWLEQERTRLRTEVAALGLRAAATLQANGALDEARLLTRRVLDIQPDDETVVRRLMLLHEASGDQVGGLAVYESHRLRLDREYAARPASETIGLADRLRSGANSARSDDDTAPPPPITPTDQLPRTEPVGEPHRPSTRPWLAAAALAMLALSVLAFLRKPGALVLGTSRPVTADDGLQIEPAISPNGRLIAFAQGTAQRMRLHVTRTAGGTPWAVSRDSTAVEIMPRWAPDNDALVYLSRNNAYVAPAVGGAARLVAEGGADERSVRSASWSPRGDSHLIVRNDSLLVIPLDGHGGRLVGTGSQLHTCTWQPTNRWIACVSGNYIALVPGALFGNRAPSALVLFPVEGGPPVPLTAHTFEHLSPAWSVDGSELWFLSNRDGTSGEVYAMRLDDDGQQAGEPRRVGVNAEAISLGQDGMAYSVASRRANIWALPIEGPPRRSLAAAARITSGNQIIEVLHAAPPQQWLVYDSNERGNSDIYRIPLGGGRAERLTDDARPEFAGTLSPDGKEIAFHQWVGAERRLRVRLLATGAVTEPLPEPGDQSVPRWSPDGQSIAFWKHGREPGAIAVVRRNLRGVWERPRWTLEGAQLPIWSTDGRQLAYVTPRGDIHTIAADSGATQLLYQPRDGSDDPIVTFLAWDSSRDRLWLLGHRPSGESGIWWIPSTGGTVPQQALVLADPEGRVNGPSLTMDATRLYFTLDERLSNIRWVELRTSK